MKIFSFILVYLLSSQTSPFSKNHPNGNLIRTQSPCKTEKDNITGKIIYTSAEISPENEGGTAALLRRYSKLSIPIPDDYDTRFIVAFIVDTSGRISGERVLRDKTDTVGKQMIAVAKSMKWNPAICYGKKVVMLRKLELQVCLELND
jgi:hypothetical protein